MAAYGNTPWDDDSEPLGTSVEHSSEDDYHWNEGPSQLGRPRRSPNTLIRNLERTSFLIEAVGFKVEEQRSRFHAQKYYSAAHNPSLSVVDREIAQTKLQHHLDKTRRFKDLKHQYMNEALGSSGARQSRRMQLQ